MPPAAAARAGPAAPAPAPPRAWQRFPFADDDARAARAGHSATADGKYIYVCGGRRGCARAPARPPRRASALPTAVL